MPISFLISIEDREEIGSTELETISSVFSAYFSCKGEVEVSLADAETIRSLNLEYRSLNEPTDVLSFPTFASLAEIQGVLDEISPLLGSIVICPAKALAYKETLPQLVHHGLLHVLGFDHEANMPEWRSKEAGILKELSRSNLIIEGVPDDSL
jgi:probable rRNA maturation factor